jgi:hypothetical protein
MRHLHNITSPGTRVKQTEYGVSFHFRSRDHRRHLERAEGRDHVPTAYALEGRRDGVFDSDPANTSRISATPVEHSQNTDAVTDGVGAGPAGRLPGGDQGLASHASGSLNNMATVHRFWI